MAGPRFQEVDSIEVQVDVPEVVCRALQDTPAEDRYRRALGWVRAVVVAAARELQRRADAEQEHFQGSRGQCLARWWDGKVVQACGRPPARNHARCSAHLPDGGLLDEAGLPLRAGVAEP